MKAQILLCKAPPISSTGLNKSCNCDALAGAKPSLLRCDFLNFFLKLHIKTKPVAGNIFSTDGIGAIHLTVDGVMVAPNTSAPGGKLVIYFTAPPSESGTWSSTALP